MDLLKSKYIDEANLVLNPYALDIEPSEGDHAFVTGYVAERGVDENARTVSGMTSTENVDRYEEIIKADAFTPWLKSFMDNPQFLAHHKMAGFDAAQATSLGQWTSLRVIEGEGLDGTAKFLEPGDELADTYWTRYRQRAMRAFSVGGIVHEWRMEKFKLSEGVEKQLRVITNMELVEISAVTIPANREALVRVASMAASGQGARVGGVDLTELAGEIRQLSKTVSAEALSKNITDTITKLAADPAGPFADVIREAIDVAVRLSDPDGVTKGLTTHQAEPGFDQQVNELFGGTTNQS